VTALETFAFKNSFVTIRRWRKAEKKSLLGVTKLTPLHAVADPHAHRLL
jgi:hypothetical protein